VKNFEFETWYGIFAPRGTPGVVVAKLNATLNKALTMPDVQDQMQKGGFEIMGGAQESFVGYFLSEVEKLGKIIRTTGAKPE
jgi:tripartite-type tricarboxylate transporter receptor subunit TctC